MSFSVGLFRDSARKDGITVSTLPATQSSDYDCNPDGLLSHDHSEPVSSPELQASPEPSNVAAEDVEGDLDEINAMISEGGPIR